MQWCDKVHEGRVFGKADWGRLAHGVARQRKDWGFVVFAATFLRLQPFVKQSI